ncbi:T9SS type A sorting domain-containing protein [Sanyastnella coralliicola]|uniref:T9SS type A sorting domain-containing protein n=1 Tax=Sanyastnella coralliicola TaxID=3069118 RepID=UPI0027BAC4F3|nr:T9SS type A sorting domain-containing protein [Longitalea sp. SCSIO 12813]
MKHILHVAFALILSSSAFAQPDSEVFPDFTYSDLNGIDQNLYSYLDQNKIVIIDIFATWCPNCVNSIPGVEAIWEEHGPDGDDSVMILSMERDANTNNEAAFVNTHGIENPVITGAEDFIANTLNVPYQPYFFVVCPDRSYELRIGGIGGDSTILTDFFEDCSSIVSVEEQQEVAFSLLNTVVDADLFVFSNGANSQFKIVSTSGQLVRSGALSFGDNNIDLSSLAAGTYVVQLTNEKGQLSQQIVKR